MNCQAEKVMSPKQCLNIPAITGYDYSVTVHNRLILWLNIKCSVATAKTCASSHVYLYSAQTRMPFEAYRNRKKRGKA
eukprot:scaffold135193_cov17-Tisochrysis_lutea.AAC.1